jgi:NADH-quinone oxidoreductase subunit M
MLWMYQRVIFGEFKATEKLHNLTDMNKREIFITASLALFIVWIGIYPSTFLKVSEKSSAKVIEQVLPESRVTFK